MKFGAAQSQVNQTGTHHLVQKLSFAEGQGSRWWVLAGTSARNTDAGGGAGDSIEDLVASR